MENNQEKKSLYYKLLIASAIIIPIIIALSYAFFIAKIKGNTTTITGTAVSEFNFNLVTENDGYISAQNLIPITTENVNTDAPKGIFNVVTGTNSYNINYELSLTDISITTGLKSADFKWQLKCTSCSNTNNDASGTFESYTSGDLVLKSNLVIASNSTDTYELRVWVQETGQDQTNNVLDQSFSAKVKAVAEFIQS